MPANLTPQYQKAEREYRRAQSPAEQIASLQRMLREIPKHKGTEKLQADLKTRLKEARAEVETEKQSPRTGRGHRIPRQGAGQAVLLGAPNSGKSRLLAELTAAEPEVAAYPFTTRDPLPGMMPWDDVRVQLIDTPPVTASHWDPALLNMVRAADLLVLCLDGSSDDAPGETADVVQQLEIRKTRPAVTNGFDEEDLSVVHVKTLLVVTRGGDPDCLIRLELFRELVATPFETVVVDFDNEESRECHSPIEMTPLVPDRNVPMLGPLKGGLDGDICDESERASSIGVVRSGARWRVDVGEGCGVIASELPAGEAVVRAVSVGG